MSYPLPVRARQGRGQTSGENGDDIMSGLFRGFHATADEMGDWDGQEEEAAACWNKFVAPALLALYETLDTDDGNPDPDGRVGHAQNDAWEKFCDTHDEETWPALGTRVAAAVKAWA